MTSLSWHGRAQLIFERFSTVGMQFDFCYLTIPISTSLEYHIAKRYGPRKSLQTRYRGLPVNLRIALFLSLP